MRKWRAPIAAVLATSMALLLGPSPATGDDGVKTVKLEIPKDATPISYLVVDKSGKPIRNISARIETTSTKRYAVIEVGTEFGVMGTCWSWAAPAPTYSWSNHTMHFGYNVQCDVAIPVRARVVLWSGPTEYSTNTWQAKAPTPAEWMYGTGSVSVGAVRPCVDWGAFAWWELMMFAEGAPPPSGNWVQFTPYPGTILRYQECMDIN